MNDAMSLVIWRFSDGRAGHDSQSRGLVQACADLVAVDSHDLGPDWPGSRTLDLLVRRFPAGAALPDPDLLVGAGHATHLPMLCARRARGGRSVVLMQPSLPCRCFDYCLIPAHDRPRTAANVIITQGALNTIVPARTRDPGRGLLLLGGPSRHYRWDEPGLLQQLLAILDAPGPAWTLADSPRTPPGMGARLEQLAGARYVPCRQAPAGWLAGELGACTSVWVTADSMSMMFEALTAGAGVGILELPARRGSRVARAVTDLAANRRVTMFSDWRHGRPLAPPRPPLDEARRCARELLERLDLVHWGREC